MFKTLWMSWNVHYSVYSEMEEFYSDKRTMTWPLLKTIVRLGLVLLGYTTLVMIGPRLMSYIRQKYGVHLRKIPLKFDFKNLLAILDCVHIGTSLWIFYETLMSGFDSGNGFTCPPYQQFWTPVTHRLAYAVAVFYYHQIFQMVDTAAIIIRDKSSQLTYLHIFYRLFTTSICWVIAKFYPVGYATSCVIMTSGVNVLIYSYYLAATLLGSKHEKLLLPKKWLTQIQIAQCVGIILHMAAGTFMDCDFPSPLAMCIVQNVGVLLYFLVKFYKKTYNKELTEHTEMETNETEQEKEIDDKMD